jgi:hypothetical protein
LRFWPPTPSAYRHNWSIANSVCSVKDIAQAEAVNALLKGYFRKNPPARTIVQVNLDQLVQVQTVAVR